MDEWVTMMANTAHVATGPEVRAQDYIESYYLYTSHQAVANSLMWVWEQASDVDTITDVQYLVNFLKSDPRGRLIQCFGFYLDRREGVLLPEKAQQLLGEFFASSDCQVEKISLVGCTDGPDVLKVLATYLPNSNTRIRKLELSYLSFETTENKTLINQLLSNKLDFESILFRKFQFDTNDNDLSFLVDGLKAQKHLVHFFCDWDNHDDSENWSKIIGNGIAPISKYSLSELEVYYPCPASSEASLPKGLIDLLEMPDSVVRRLRLPKFTGRLDGIHKRFCSQVCQIVQNTNMALQEVTLRESGTRAPITPVDEYLYWFCQRNKLYGETQELFIHHPVPKKEEYAAFLVTLKYVPDEIGLLPIFTMFRGRPDLVSDSFFKDFLLLLKQKG